MSTIGPKSLFGSSVVLEETGTRRRVSYTLVTADVIGASELS